MKYPRETRNLPLILGAGGTGILKWWIDALLTVHANMRVHNGGGMYIGRGFPFVTSTKQKLNNLIST